MRMAPKLGHGVGMIAKSRHGFFPAIFWRFVGQTRRTELVLNLFGDWRLSVLVLNSFDLGFQRGVRVGRGGHVWFSRKWRWFGRWTWRRLCARNWVFVIVLMNAETVVVVLIRVTQFPVAKVVCSVGCSAKSKWARILEFCGRIHTFAQNVRIVHDRIATLCPTSYRFCWRLSFGNLLHFAKKNVFFRI